MNDSGVNAGITSLTTDGTQIYGTGYVFGPGGNLEGSFAADPDTGAINWIEDCHGDTYDSFPMGQILYVVSHSHYCGNIGAFPQTEPVELPPRHGVHHLPDRHRRPQLRRQLHRLVRQPAPTQLDWYPTLTTGHLHGSGAGCLVGDRQQPVHRTRR